VVVAALGLALTVAAVAVAVTVGIVHVPSGEVLRALAHAFAHFGGAGSRTLDESLVLDMRLPRAVGAVCVGAALGAAGCMLQALMRNPLASPTVIGTAQAAAFGKVLGVFVGFGFSASIGLSFATSTVAALLVLTLARTRAGLPAISVVLMGINMSLFFGALAGLTVFLSRDEDQLARMALLLAGGLWRTTWPSLAIVAPATVLAVLGSLVFARPLDILALGETDAKRLGMNTATTGTTVLLLACLLTSLAVSVAGVVAFVGLVVPHAARRLVGQTHRALLPACAFLGATLVVLTDTLARSVAPPNELPLTVITSLLGVPCFVVIVRSLQRGSGEA
jgi:iron complex transport system permease protein